MILRLPVLVVLLSSFVFARMAAAQDGAALYKELCSSCHDTAVDRAPSREALRAMSPQRILDAMEAGPMVAMTQLRSAAERRAIAEFASGRGFGTPFSIAPAQKAMCTAGRGTFTMTPAGPAWNGFGQNASNTRFQNAPGAGLSAADVPKLKLKWAFGLPGDVQSWAGITLAGGRLFFGSIQGNVYSLDAKTGCVQWAYDAGAIVRTAISVGPLGTTGRFGAFF
ncbi:MAG TPA: PQQ-binding-like beta-propeller repeat protein, partial [Vicinamibacterales bacterium]|nr:PQQ-binding-like beta-propeller repeat protein [Vicinamibacterales bacterium]